MNNTLYTEEVSTQQCVPGGYVALGHRGELHYVWSRVTQQVVAISPAGFTAMKLKAAFGARWCNARYTVYPDKGAPYFDHETMADEIMADCQAAGIYRESKLRGAGVWLSDDGLVINGRDGVWTSDGKVLERVSQDGAVVYSLEKNELDIAPEDAAAAPEDVLEVEQAIDAWEWNSLSAGALVMGWTVCAVLAGALGWRAHLYITGRAGAGKSTFARLLGAMFGKAAARPTGQLTQAGLLQTLGARAIPCIVDETEAGKFNRSTLAALEVARWASSMSEADDGVLRGTAGGRAIAYRVFSPFAFLGINLPKLEHADQSRAVTLEMLSQRRRADSMVPRLLTDERHAVQLGRKLRRLAIGRWPVFKAALPRFRQAIIDRDGTARQADTLGSLMAGYWCIKSAKEPTAAEVSSLTDCLPLSTTEDALAETDEVRCQDVLMYSKVTVPVSERLGETHRTMTVADAIRHYCAAPLAQWRLDNALQNYGLRLFEKNGVWKVAVASSSAHRELQRFFAGTPWKYGCWSRILRRLPGGEGDTQRIAKRACKVTMFNVPADVLADLDIASSEDGGMNEMRMAA